MFVIQFEMGLLMDIGVSPKITFMGSILRYHCWHPFVYVHTYQKIYLIASSEYENFYTVRHNEMLDPVLHQSKPLYSFRIVWFFLTTDKCSYLFRVYSFNTVLQFSRDSQAQEFTKNWWERNKIDLFYCHMNKMKLLIWLITSKKCMANPW